MSYLLYKKESLRPGTSIDSQADDIDIRAIRLRPFSFFAKEENFSCKVFLLRLYFAVITLFQTKLYYAVEKGKVIHTSYVVPKCFKFPFLEKNDFEIGPCFTSPEHRGKGIYPKVLRHVLKTGSSKTCFYMLVHSTNESSIKGVEKAGFSRCGLCERGRFNIYRKVVDES